LQLRDNDVTGPAVPSPNILHKIRIEPALSCNAHLQCVNYTELDIVNARCKWTRQETVSTAGLNQDISLSADDGDLYEDDPGEVLCLPADDDDLHENCSGDEGCNSVYDNCSGDEDCHCVEPINFKEPEKTTTN
jgi:hypothetical protein